MSVLTESYFDYLKSSEGYYVNDKDDFGGETNRGITLNTYKSYAPKLFGSYSYQRFLNMSENDWRLIVKTIWDESKASSINSQAIALYYFDWYFGSYNESWEYLATALGLPSDTRKATILDTVNNSNISENSILSKYHYLRLQFYRSIASKGNNKKFLSGWLIRAENNLKLSIKYVSGNNYLTFLIIIILLFLVSRFNKIL